MRTTREEKRAYSALGEVPKAIDFYQRALAIAQEIGRSEERRVRVRE